jgi:hypothetical protein
MRHWRLNPYMKGKGKQVDPAGEVWGFTMEGSATRYVDTSEHSDMYGGFVYNDGHTARVASSQAQLHAALTRDCNPMLGREGERLNPQGTRG